MRKILLTFLEYILVLFLILEFNTPYLYFPLIRHIVLAVPFTVTIMILFLCKGRFRFDYLSVIVIIGSIPLLLFVNIERVLSFIYVYLLMLPALILYFSNFFRSKGLLALDIFIKYSNVVCIIAVVSLMFWIFGSFLEILEPTSFIPNAWAGERFIPTYYGIYFETQEDAVIADLGSMFIRNSGLFNEAPMYNMILCIAFSIELFIRKIRSSWRIIVLLVSIMSTFTSTGYIFITIMILIKFFHIFGAARQITKILVFLVSIIMFVFISIVTIDNKRETGGHSYDSRSYDIERCLEVGMDNPLFGIGLFNPSEEFGSSKVNFGYSNSLFGVFAHGGFYAFTFYTLSLIIFPLLCFQKWKNRDILYFQVFFFILFSVTVSQYKYLTMMMIAFALSYWRNIIFYNKRHHRIKWGRIC